MKEIKPPKPSKEMQKAFDEVPKIVKRNIREAKHKEKIQKNFRDSLGHIFGKQKKSKP